MLKSALKRDTEQSVVADTTIHLAINYFIKYQTLDFW